MFSLCFFMLLQCFLMFFEFSFVFVFLFVFLFSRVFFPYGFWDEFLCFSILVFFGLFPK